MNDTIAIRKDSSAGQALRRGADYIGIDPEDLLMGICFNSMKRKSNPLLPAPQQAPAPAPEKQQELAIITPKPEPAGSTGLFDDFGAA